MSPRFLLPRPLPPRSVPPGPIPPGPIPGVHRPWLRVPGRALLLGIILLLTALMAGAHADEADSIMQLIESGDLTRAESALRAHLETADDPQARDLLGVVLSRQGRSAEAEEQFRRAISAAPEALGPRQNLARHLLLAGREADALSELRAAAALGALERDLALKLAVLEGAAGREEAAETQLRQLAESHDSVQARLYLAQLLTGRGDAEGALAILREAVARAPNSEEVLLAYARAALDARSPVPAILALEPLSRMFPQETDYFYLMGVARLQAGDWSGSEEAFEQASWLQPTRALSLIGLGIARNGQKRFAEAKEALLAAQRLAPDHVEVLAALAEAEEGLTQLEEAETHALRALAQAPDHATANLALGMVRMKQERYAEAREALERAVEADPGSPKTHYQLSLAHARLGDRESSARHLQLYREALDAFEDSLRELEGSASAHEAPSEGNDDDEM